MARGMRQEVLLEHASTIRDAPMEHGIVLDYDGEVCTRLSGGRSSIVFDHRTLTAACHRVFMHNHPRGGAFSTADIWTACVLCMRGMVVVTHDRVHCLAPPGGRDFFCRDDYADIVRCYRFRCLTADLSTRLTPPEEIWTAVAVDMDLGYGVLYFEKG
ncbi:MAG: hypothetical protein PHQ81_09940 [Methanofollis sp.]|nr:hypothetical protein [Methanofollis sp.]